MAELGGDHRTAATSLQRRAEHLLALAIPVEVGRVEEVDARVERCMDDTRGSLGVEAAPEVVAPDADDADRQHTAELARLVFAHAGQGTQTSSLLSPWRLLG